MTEQVFVASEEEFEQGEAKIVAVDEDRVGVFKIDERYFAVENNCAHQDGPVCTGKLTKNLTGEFVGNGKRVKQVYEDSPVIACPYHGWEYDLETGNHLGDPNPRFSLQTYEVLVEDGDVFVLG